MTMDLTVARNGMQYWGAYRASPFKLTGPSSYATGGISHPAKDVGLGVVDIMPEVILHSGTAVRIAVYDYTTEKYVVYVPNTGAEVANGVDLSTFTGRGVALGR